MKNIYKIFLVGLIAAGSTISCTDSELAIDSLYEGVDKSGAFIRTIESPFQLVNLTDPTKNFIAATIDFQLKPRVIQFAESLGLKPFSIIHPSAFIDESAEICEGVFVGPQAVVSANARIGNHSIIHIHSSIGHDSQIGEYCAILPGARISGDVVLEDHVLIGSNSFVFQGTQVGRNARIDALTYVRDDIPEKSTLSCRRSNH